MVDLDSAERLGTEIARMSEREVDKKYNAREDVVFTDLDDGSAVLLHLETKYYFSLNETAAFLWKVLESGEGVTVEEMIQEMCDVFDVDRDQAKTDVDDFVSSLLEQGLIK